MKRNFGILALLMCVSAVFSQENYLLWPSYKDITVNTSATGANITGGVGRYPMLVRLASTNFSDFAVAGTRASLRFSRAGVHLPYEIERWDSAGGNLAEIWVLADTLTGNNSTQTIQMFWGKSGAADSSNGKTVFDTLNGYTGVYHMNEPQGTGPKDATANALNFAAHASVTRGVGTIDSARTYAGGASGTPDSLPTRSDKFNVTNTKFTISAWVIRPASNSSQYEGIFSNWRYSAGNTRSYILEEKSNGSYAIQVSSGGSADDRIPQTSTTFSNAAWHYVVGSMSPTNGIRIFVDGVSQALTGAADAVDPFVNTTASARPLIGAMERANTQPFVGSIDEVEVSVNTERSADWIKLNYATQVAGQTVVTYGATVSLAVPGAPTGVTDTAGNGQVIVVWLAPSSNGGAAITGYKVTAVQDTSKHCNTTGSLTCTVTGLTNGTAYSFTVTATNSVGTSAASTASATVTPIAPPGVPGLPTGVSAVPGNAQATVSWTAPSSDGGSAITGYKVTSSPDGKNCTTTGALTCTVTALTNATAYTFTVTATNTSGSSAASVASIAITPVGPPGAPTNIIGASGNALVVVSWTAPVSNGGSVVTGYKAMAVSDTTKSCTTTGALTCTITGLTNGTGYTFVVQASNSAGASTASTASATVTPTTIPGAPTNVVGTGGTAGQITVSWTAPASNGGGTITGYIVNVVQDTGNHCTTTGALSCVVTSLINTNVYNFTVVAVNAAGKGPASAQSGPSSGIFAVAKNIAFHRTGSSMLLRLPEFSGRAEVTIVDIWGRVVWSQTVEAGTREVTWQKGSSRSIAPGLYIVRIMAQDAGRKPRLAAESKLMLTP